MSREFLATHLISGLWWRRGQQGMLIREIAEVVIGIALVALALRDVFDTVVVPGESAGALRVARRLLFMMLPVWKRLRRGKTGISTSFAPSVLMASFVAWMAILLFGFGLVAHGLGNWFSPPADSLEQAVFIAGSALATVGLSGIEAHGPARWVLVAAGICGLAVLTMAVTYLIEVQEGISKRDAGVLKITTTSGEPPSALGLLERYADLDGPEEMRRALYDGRDWCATVLQTHASHPSLIYFRSVGTGAGWPAALGTVMDLALIFELLIDDPRSRAAAVLLRDEGLRLVGEIAEKPHLHMPGNGGERTTPTRMRGWRRIRRLFVHRLLPRPLYGPENRPGV